MGKTIKYPHNSALLMSVLLFLAFSTHALANLPTNGNSGGSEKKTGNENAKTTVSIPTKEWVIVEVIDNPGNINEQPVVNIEKKNISQVAVTRIEVRNCKQSTLPPELVQLMGQLSNTPNGRKVYKKEEGGKTTYYISPVSDDQKQEQPAPVDPASLTLPLFLNMKI